MSLLPRVTEASREMIAREFETRGSEVCLAEVVQRLERENPGFLDMATKCAEDLGDPARLMVGFGMLYRLLTMPSPATNGRTATLPRVDAQTRDLLVTEIDEKGAEAFTMDAVDELEANNPELLQLAHSFALGSTDYLRAMPGFRTSLQIAYCPSARRARPTPLNHLTGCSRNNAFPATFNTHAPCLRTSSGRRCPAGISLPMRRERPARGDP